MVRSCNRRSWRDLPLKGQISSIVTPDLIRGPAFPRLLRGTPDQVRGDDAGEASITRAPRVTNPRKCPMGAPDHDNQDPPRPAEGRHGVARLPEGTRSEEHTSELQSLMRISYAVFCL